MVRSKARSWPAGACCAAIHSTPGATIPSNRSIVFSMRKKLIFITTILLGAFLLSACAGGPVHGSTWPGLATDGNLAYLADGPFVYAINLEDGREVWRYPGERDNGLVFYATPAVTPLYAGFCRRGAACLLDNAILLVPSLPLASSIANPTNAKPSTVMASSHTNDMNAVRYSVYVTPNCDLS